MGYVGEAWRQAGKTIHKQNVFDDFIAAAEYLIHERTPNTLAARLAVQDSGHGGLLVGAVMTQRPDLFERPLPGVGVMDMLRYHRFTARWVWVDEYGKIDDAEQFTSILKYSPYHNLRPVGHTILQH